MPDKYAASMSVAIDIDKSDVIKQTIEALNIAQKQADGQSIVYKITGDKKELTHLLNTIGTLEPGSVKIHFDSSEFEKDIANIEKTVSKNAATVGNNFSENIKKSLKSSDIKAIVSDVLNIDVNKIDSARHLEDTARKLRKTIDSIDIQSAFGNGDFQTVNKYIESFEKLGSVIQYLNTKGIKNTLSAKTYNFDAIKTEFANVFSSDIAVQSLDSFRTNFNNEFNDIINAINNGFGNIKKTVSISGGDIGLNTIADNISETTEQIKEKIEDLKYQIEDMEAIKEEINSLWSSRVNLENKYKNGSISLSDYDNQSESIYNKLIKNAEDYLEYGGSLNDFSADIKKFFKDVSNIDGDLIFGNDAFKPSKGIDSLITQLNQYENKLKDVEEAQNRVSSTSSSSPVTGGISNVDSSVEGKISKTEVVDLQQIKSAVEQVTYALKEKTNAIKEEELQMQSSSAKEVAFLKDISQQAEVVKTDLKQLNLDDLSISDINDNFNIKPLIKNLEQLTAQRDDIDKTANKLLDFAIALEEVGKNTNAVNVLKSFYIKKNATNNFDNLIKGFKNLKEALNDIPDTQNVFLNTINEILDKGESLSNLAKILGTSAKQIDKVKKALDSPEDSKSIKKTSSYDNLLNSLKEVETARKNLANAQKRSNNDNEINELSDRLQQAEINYKKLQSIAFADETFDKGAYEEAARAITNEAEAYIKLAQAKRLDSETKASQQEDAKSIQNINKSIQQLEALQSRIKVYKEITATGLFSSNSVEAQGFVNQFSSLSSDVDKLLAKLKTLKSVSNESFDSKQIKELKDEASKLSSDFSTLKNNIKAAGYQFKSWGDAFKSAFDTFKNYFISGNIFQWIEQGTRELFTMVSEYDTSVTNLRIASGSNKSEVEGLMSTYNDMAKSLGATTTEMAESADTWIRQGYNISDTNKLIEASLVQSKIGQLEAAESTQYLTSALKGYKVEVEDAMSVVDAMSAVDLTAAVSLGGLAEGMAETANSARIAGVSMEKLLGYLAVVGEVTQDDMGAVGNSFKRIFSRMGNVRAGKFVSDEGEDLSDVEKVLGELGINLRDSEQEFRNFGDVLDDIAGSWTTYTSVEQRAIVTALAGATQAEKLLVLLENYSDALKYTETAYNSSGTAMEKFEAYQDSVGAKTKELKASLEGLANNLIDNDEVKSGIDLLSGFVNILDKLIEKIGPLTTLSLVMSGIAGKKGLGLTLTFKNYSLQAPYYA